MSLTIRAPGSVSFVVEDADFTAPGKLSPCTTRSISDATFPMTDDHSDHWDLPEDTSSLEEEEEEDVVEEPVAVINNDEPLPNDSATESSVGIPGPALPEIAREASPFATSPLTPRRSIIRQDSLVQSVDQMFIKEERCSWKSMPPPNLDQIIKTRSVSDSAIPSSTQTKARRRVTFDKISFREFAQTIGDNPSVSYGTPVSLDWDYEDTIQTTVGDYELERPPRRKMRNMILNYYHRKNLLTHVCGFSEAEVKEAAKEANKIKGQRNMTRTLLPYMAIDHAVRAGVRKVKRLPSLGRKKSQESS